MWNGHLHGDARFVFSMSGAPPPLAPIRRVGLCALPPGADAVQMWAGAGPWGCGHGGTIWGAGEGQWLWKLETWGTKEQFQGRRAGRRWSSSPRGAPRRLRAPGKSGLHARGEGERVLALESREGTRVSRRLEEGLSRPWEAQSSPRVARESWGLRSSPQETWVQSLGQEDPLEEGMATNSSILA